MKHKQGTIAEYLSALRESDRFGPQVVAHRRLEACDADFGPTLSGLPPEINTLIEKIGIRQLYSHQVQAVNLILQGKNVLTATPTASGKSLIYNLPVFAGLINNPQSRALYLFPLKALAQDQLKTVETMASRLPGFFADQGRVPAAAYDGDTSSYLRKKIRDNPPSILISNPDMLHLALLPYHDLWGSLFANLTHVIIDEVHTYRGVFGSHMAWVIRRLKRICNLYGSSPVFVLSSATVGNPEELGEKLIGGPVQVITRSGAPRAPRNILLLNPLDSSAYTASLLLQAAVNRNLRTIVYTRSRKMTELITMWTDKRIGRLQDKITSYRAGFLPEDRRDIEQRLSDGRLLGVITTSALELGIDIGSLDICLLVGYPGSMMATRQRAGRVGRGRRESLVVLIGHEDALDQHFMRHPDDFFAREVEAVVLNPENKTIMGRHLVCAAAESPITTSDSLYGLELVPELLDHLTLHGDLLQSSEGSTWFAARKYPQRDVDLRGSGTRYQIRRSDNRELLGDIDGIRAFKECHSGAVYLHMARTWLVEHLDLEGREILASPQQPHYFTRAMSHKKTEILGTESSAICKAARIHFGSLRVTETISGYQRILIGSRKIIGRFPLDLPPQIFETEGIWIEIPERIRQEMEQRQFHFMGGIHAMEHAMIAMLPLLVLCDRNDIGGISHPWHDQLGGAGIFIYDGYSGGVGLMRKGFSLIRQLMEKTLEAVSNCPCDFGCPSCVHSPKCGSGNRPIDKEACIRIMTSLLQDDQQGPSINMNHRQSPGGRHPTHRPAAPEKAPFALTARYGVFDVETKRSALEVGGWHHANRMGISVAVLYDSGEDNYFSFQENETTALIERLFQMDLVIGFNNKRFDNRVLSAYTKLDLGRLPSFDILEEITKQLGYRLSLDRLAEQTLGVKKNGNGLQALKWFQQGRMDLLTSYCKKDVEITRDLFLYGLRMQRLLFRNKAGNVVRLPVHFRKSVESIQKKTRPGSRPDEIFIDPST